LSGETHSGGGGKPWQKWAFAVVPAAGILELGAHLVQAHSTVPDSDWQAAQQYVKAHAAPEDGISFAPRWVDPIGREQFGPTLATLEREAPPDETRFPRAFEVSIRGGHAPSLAGWRHSAESRFGGVTVTTLENPAPAHVIDDLVSRVDPAHMRVSRVGGGRDEDCGWEHGGPQTGQLGFGTAVPADRFSCAGGGFVGVSVVEDTEYYPHRCIYAPPSGGTLRLRFGEVAFGHTLHGHHALYVEAEHAMKAPVTITFSVAGRVLGSAIHRDLEGWKGFELDTGDLTGTRADLVADIDCTTAERRMYCFEADTR
jgi:hypothetical protein